MPKRLRRDSKIYIAPEILGWLDDNYNPIAKDQRNDRNLNPTNIDDKILIYERQVKGWFLEPATSFTSVANNGFIVLMICMAYLEGVQQYIRGESSYNRSQEFFKDAIDRIYPNKFQPYQLEDFYQEARCGLFHDGMVRGKIVISYEFNKSIEFTESATINVNPQKLLDDIKVDYENFIRRLKTNNDSRDIFDRMYSNL